MAKNNTNPGGGDSGARQAFSFRPNDPAENSQLTATKQRPTGAGRPDRLAVFELRAWARARLWQVGELSLHDAVDELQAAAERDGLVDKLGQDGVQHILAEAFGRVR